MTDLLEVTLEQAGRWSLNRKVQRNPVRRVLPQTGTPSETYILNHETIKPDMQGFILHFNFWWINKLVLVSSLCFKIIHEDLQTIGMYIRTSERRLFTIVVLLTNQWYKFWPCFSIEYSRISLVRSVGVWHHFALMGSFMFSCYLSPISFVIAWNKIKDTEKTHLVGVFPYYFSSW